MSKKASEAIYTLIGVLIILLLAVGAYKVLAALGEAIRSVNWGNLNPGVAAAVIAGVVSIGGIVVGQFLNRMQAVKLENRKKQVEAYDNFLDELFQYFNETDDIAKQKHFEHINREFTKNVLLWSSNKVLKKYFEYKEYAKNNPGDGVGTLAQLEELIIAMRRDLGHRKKMKPGELLSVMFNETSAELKEMMGRDKKK